MVGFPFNLSGGHLPTERTTPSLVQERTPHNVDHIFTLHGFQYITSHFITIHVEQYNIWKESDVRDPKNRIELLWVPGGRRSNHTLDDIRSKLDKKRVLSDVCVLSILSFVLLSHLAQPDLLRKPQYEAINAVKDQLFDTGQGTNIVSDHELDAHNNAVANYMNWVDKIRSLSSFLKDGWFTNALVTPPMLEVVDSNEPSRQEYKFNRYVHNSILALMLKI